MHIKEYDDCIMAVDEATFYIRDENKELPRNEQYHLFVTVYLKSGIIHEGKGVPTLTKKTKLFCLDGFYAPLGHIEALRFAVGRMTTNIEPEEGN